MVNKRVYSVYSSASQSLIYFWAACSSVLIKSFYDAAHMELWIP